MSKYIENLGSKEEFKNIVIDLLNNEDVLKMKNYRQHFNTNCYEHSIIVAYMTFVMCKKLKLNYVDATRAALLHDLFLYDWREKDSSHKWHAFHHGKKAYDNAKKIMNITSMQEDMIVNHMWPVTPKFPKYKETYVLTVTDKMSVLLELSIYLKENIFLRNKVA